jgi:hypothetical protein
MEELASDLYYDIIMTLLPCHAYLTMAASTMTLSMADFKLASIRF